MKALAGQALKAGATKGEIAEAIRVAQYICGVGSVYTAAHAFSNDAESVAHEIALEPGGALLKVGESRCAMKVTRIAELIIAKLGPKFP